MSKTFKFVTVNTLCDRLERGEITVNAFIRFCEFYEEQVSFIASHPTVVENGVRFKQIEAGPGTRKLRVA